MALNRYHKAITAFDQALKLNPHLVECYHLKGKCYYKLKQYLDAHDQYELVIQYNADSISIYNDLGNVLLALHNYVDAIEAFNKAIVCMTEDTKYAYCGKGSALSMQGKNKEALRAFEQANKLDPSLCLQPQYRHIIEDIKYSIEAHLRTSPQDAVAYKLKGDALRLLGERGNDIIGAYTLAIEYGNRTADTYFYRGEAYYILQEYQNALYDYREAVNLDPSHQKAQQKIREIEDMTPPHSRGFFARLAFWKKIL